MKRVLSAVLCIMFSAMSLCACSGKTPKTNVASFDAFVFDTYCNIILFTESQSASEDVSLALKKAKGVLDIDGYGKQFIAVRDGQSIKLNQVQKQILETADSVRLLSGGKYDVAIASLISLWDISNATAPPGDTDIMKALSVCGSDKLDITGETLTAEVAGAGVDIGSVGKGFAGDYIVKMLKDGGYTSGIVNLGGNITVFGENPNKDSRLYTVGIKDPNDPSKLFCTVSVSDTSVITSGAYERFFTYQGKRYHHILDPYTGFPSESDLCSATVISDNGTLADALSTALFICGSEKGLEILSAVTADYGPVSAVMLKNDGEIVIYNGEELNFKKVSDSYRAGGET